MLSWHDSLRHHVYCRASDNSFTLYPSSYSDRSWSKYCWAEPVASGLDGAGDGGELCRFFVPASRRFESVRRVRGLHSPRDVLHSGAFWDWISYA